MSLCLSDFQRKIHLCCSSRCCEFIDISDRAAVQKWPSFVSLADVMAAHFQRANIDRHWLLVSEHLGNLYWHKLWCYLAGSAFKFDHVHDHWGFKVWRVVEHSYSMSTKLNWMHRNYQWLITTDNVRNSLTTLMSLSKWTGVTQDAVPCRWQCN